MDDAAAPLVKSAQLRLRDVTLVGSEEIPRRLRHVRSRSRSRRSERTTTSVCYEISMYIEQSAKSCQLMYKVHEYINISNRNAECVSAMSRNLSHVNKVVRYE